MGAWGPALFSDDLACDVRDLYRELIEDEVADDEAIRQVIVRFAEITDDPDEGPVFWLALAHTSSKVGRLTPELLDRAVAIIDEEQGLRLWREDAKLLKRRKAALAKVRAQLTGPQPEPKKLRPPSRHITDLAPGDVLAYRTGDRYVLFRVARVSESRVAVAPILVRLKYDAAALPQPERLGKLRDLRFSGPTGRYRPGYMTTCLAMTIRKVTYGDAGFIKIGHTDRPRKGDADREPRSYVDWAALARSLDHQASGAGPDDPI